MWRMLACGALVDLGQRSCGAHLLHVLAIHLGYAFASSMLAGGLTTRLTLVVTNHAAELLHWIVGAPGSKPRDISGSLR